MQIMLSELQQKNVWEGWISSEVRSHYFAELCHHYQWLQRLITWLTLASSSGAAVTILASLPEEWQWLRPALAVCTAGLSLWSLVANYNNNATECSDLHFRWNTLEIDYESLWNNMYAPNAQSTLQELRKRESELSRGSASLPNNVDRMRKWQRHVHRHHGCENAA